MSYGHLKLVAVLLVSGASADSSPSPPLGIVGLGSNVVDRFFRVRGADGLAPVVGQKGYFASEGEVVGGVTLNHLSWAAALGCPAALAALQGEDEAGRLIRAAMQEHGVLSDALTISADVSSSVCHVILDESGERTILMAPHATTLLDGAAVDRFFAAAVARASLVTTEISQVPVSGVSAFLELANAHNVPSVLDVDVPPSVAAAAASLCEAPIDCLACAKLCTVLKVTRDAARELLGLADYVDQVPTDPAALAAALQRATGVPLVAVTAGSSGGALAAAGGASASLPPPEADVSIVDTTGAGDAFLGGLLSALWRLGLPDTGTLPSSEAELVACLQAANAAGAACCEVLGGLPPVGASGLDRVVELMGGADVAGSILPLRGGATPRPHGSARLRGGALDAAAAGDAMAAAAGMPGGSGSGSNFAGGVSSAGVLSTVADSFAADAATAATLASDSRLHASIVTASAALADARDRGGVCLVTGLGKSGSVARRLAASLASTGCRAHYVHSAEWAHGDLGNMPPSAEAAAAAPPTTLIAISHSGKTAEVAGACREAAARGVRVVVIAGGGCAAAAASPAGAVATHVLGYALPVGVIEPYGGAPTASIVAQEAVANALVRALAERAAFTPQRFRHNHPGGALGESLGKL